MADLDEVCEKILKVHSKIRFAGIYHQGVFRSKTREGLQTLLTEEESKRSVVEAVKRWETRHSLASKLGHPVYSMTKYAKVNRMTLPIGEEGLVLISTDTSLDPNTVVDKILEIKNRNFGQLS